MKILVVAPLPPQAQPTNAVPLVTNALLAALAPRHHVTLLTVSDSTRHDERTLERWRMHGVEVHCVTRRPARGISRWARRFRLAAKWLGGVPWRTVWYWEPGLQSALNALLARESFDVVAAQDNAAGIYDFGTQTPTVLTEMEVRAPTRRGFSGGHRWERVFYEQDAGRWQTYQRAAWQKFDRIQVLTSRDAGTIGKVAPEICARTRVNPFGVEVPREICPEREQAGHLVFVGGFTHAPNVDAAQWFVQEIFPRITARCPHTTLALVGSYPPAPVRALARHNITLAANVPIIEPFLQQASLVVAPLRHGGGQRIKVLQGMAHGKAVVTTPLGAEGLEIYGKPPLCIASDATSFADAVVYLLAATETRRALGARAREFVQAHFSPEAYAQRLESMYGELLGSPV